MSEIAVFDMNDAMRQLGRQILDDRRHSKRSRSWHAPTRYTLLQGKGSVLDPDGSTVWQDEEWMPNALTNDGEADLIAQIFKNSIAERATYYLGLTLVSTATTNRPGNTSHATDLTQTALNGTTTVTEQNTGDGYGRQSVITSGWGANSGTQPTTSAAPQVTFGPATTTAWTGTTTSPGQIQDAIMSTAASGTTGVLMLFLALSATTSIALGQSFAYTFTIKVT